MKAKTLGYRGESVAANYLRGKGYQILKNNFTVRGGEIDIVAKQGNTFVFVEVKTRNCDMFGYGDESMNRSKIVRLHRAIERYIDTLAESDPDYRLDLIEISLPSNPSKSPQITHFEDIEL